MQSPVKTSANPTVGSEAGMAFTPRWGSGLGLQNFTLTCHWMPAVSGQGTLITVLDNCVGTKATTDKENHSIISEHPLPVLKCLAL